MAIKCAPHQRSGHGMLAIKSLLMDFPFEAVAKLFAISRRTPSRWVRTLMSLVSTASSTASVATDRAKAGDLVEALDHPERASHAHWTGRKYHGYFQETLGITLGYTTVNRFMHTHG